MWLLPPPQVLAMGMQEHKHDATSPDRLPAYWGRRPGFHISVDNTSTETSSDGSASPPSDTRSQPQGEHTQEGMVPAHAAGHRCTRQLKTYAQLLSEETVAMKNAVGPWQPRMEKSSKLMVCICSPPCFHPVRLQIFHAAEHPDMCKALFCPICPSWMI